MSGVLGLVKIAELRKRILFTLLLLTVYRVGVHVPTPGVDGFALKQVFAQMQNTLFGWFNLFSGGALERFSIFALGVGPYITSSILFQLLTVLWPELHELQKEGEQGRKKMNQYTRYGAVFFCLLQSYGIATGLEHYQNPSVVLAPGFGFRFMTTCTLTAGTLFLMWMGEQITERGIGNGISLLIYAGIAAHIPQGLGSALQLLRSGELSAFKIGLVGAIIVATFFGIIFMERGARRIPVHYAKRIVGRKIYGGQNTFLPLKVNTSGVIPPIFASSFLMFPATILTFFPSEKMQQMLSWLQPGGMLYQVLFVSLIVFFCYIYAAISFKTDDIAESLKKNGGFIPDIRPGAPTAQYLDWILSRILLGGAVYISVICVLPTVMTQALKVPFYFGGTGVLILVGVALDTVAQVETFLLSKNYEGFMRHTRVKGRTAFS